MARNVIEAERLKKQEKKAFIIIGAVTYLLLMLLVLHYQSISAVTPRGEFGDILGMAFVDIFTHPFNMSPTGSLIGIFLGGTALVACYFLIKKSDRELRKHDNVETVQGDARWMNTNDLAEYNKKRTSPFGSTESSGKDNIILTKDLKLSMNNKKARRNVNVMVFGSSGSGKSVNVGANLLQYNANYVVTDPSGELLRKYGKALENEGYEVIVFNTSCVYQGNRYNPFHYLHSEKDILIFVNALIKNTTPPKEHSGDPFWEKSETTLIYALMLYIWHVCEPKDQTFQTLMNMLRKAEVDENDDSSESELDRLFDDLARKDPNNLAVKNYEIIRKSAGKTLKSILLSVGVRLMAFDLLDMIYLTAKDEMNFETFGDTKKALFVIIPTAEPTFNFIVSLLYTQMFMTLYSYVEQVSQYGWILRINGGDSIKVFHAANLEDSNRAKAEAEALLADVKAGVTIKKNKDRNLFEVYTKSGNVLVGWRGTKESAKAFAASLKDAVIERCPGPLREEGEDPTLPNHVRFILDEFANIGQIPEFSEKLATIRKYSISCTLFLQSLAQLKTSYDKEWNSIMGNCDVKLNLGTDDLETNEWFNKRLGKKTARVENQSLQANGNGSTSYNLVAVDLMSVNALFEMDDRDCVCLIRGEHSYKGKKYDTFNHPNYKTAIATAGEFELPSSPKHKKLIEYHSLPYRERVKLIEAGEDIPELSTSDVPAANNEPGEPVDDSVKNAVAKKEAIKAERALKELEDRNEPSAEDIAMAEMLMSTLNIKEGDSKEVIKERIETLIDIDHIDESMIFDEQ